MFRVGMWAFPCDYKALKWGQEAWILGLSWTLWKKDMFRVGKLKAVSLFSCGLCCFAVLLDR